jgi:hypothetical protein
MSNSGPAVLFNSQKVATRAPKRLSARAMIMARAKSIVQTKRALLKRLSLELPDVIKREKNQQRKPTAILQKAKPRVGRKPIKALSRNSM